MALFIPLLVRTILMYSENFRAKYYHKLTPTIIDQITGQSQSCWFTEGVIVGKGKPVTLSLLGNVLKLQFSEGSEIDIPVNSIKKTEIPNVGWLVIHPNDEKVLAFSNDGRIGLFFGTSQLQKAYSWDLPFFWQPYASIVREADKKAEAFYAKINLLRNSNS